jgi:predicted amidohydrolase
MPFKAACVQLNAGADVAANLGAAADGVRAAAAAGANFILLPEYAILLDGSGRVMREHSPPEPEHPAVPAFSALARETGAWLLVGSITVRVDGDLMANRSLLISAAGEIVARYDKIHMFDVTLPSGKTIRESSAYRPGDRLMLAETPWGRLGMTVCYDLRFPQLYRALAQAGAELLAIPASFQRETGKAHWHALVRARAIENGAYVLAPAMCGDHPNGRQTYGHSLIVDPWGEVLADGGEAPGLAVAEIEPARVRQVRGMIPSLEHDRSFQLR